MDRAGGHDNARGKLLQLELEHASTATRRCHLARQAARLAAQADDDDAAAVLWQRALDEVDDCLDALAALDRHCEITGDSARRFALLGKRLLYTPCRSTKTYCRIERANALVTGDRPATEALAEVDAVLAYDELHPIALYLAQHLTAVTSDWARHIDIVSQRRKLANKPRAKAILEFGLGLASRYGLARHDDAVTRLESALAVDPSLNVPRNQLAELYLHAENWTALRAVIGDGPDVALPHVWSTVAWQLQLEPDAICGWFLRAMSAEPHDLLLKLHGIAALRRAADFEQLARAASNLGEQLDASGGDSRDRVCAGLLAAWATLCSGAVPRANELYAACASDDQPGPLASANWVRLASAVSDGTPVAERIADITTRLAATSDTPSRVALQLELGLEFERGSDHVRADAAYQEALELDPDNRFITLLAAAVPNAPRPATSAALAQWVGQTPCKPLGAALLAWHARFLDPTHARAFIGRAVQMHAGQPAVSWMAARLDGSFEAADQAAAAYARLAESSRDPLHRGVWAVCAVLAAGFANSDVPRAATAALARVADDALLYDVLPALASGPQLLDLTLERGFGPDHERIVDLTRNVEQSLEAVSQSIILRERLARRRPLAGADARMLADLEGDLRYVRLHAGVHLWAHRRLAELYQWRGDGAQLVDTLRNWARQAAGAEASMVYTALAEVLSHGRARTPALGALERAAATRPDDFAVNAQLARNYAEQGRTVEANGVLVAYVEQAEDPDMLAAALREVAWIDPDQSEPEHESGSGGDQHIARLERLANLEPHDWATGFALVAALRSSADDAKRIAALDRLIEHLRDDTSRVTLLCELGERLTVSERDPDRGERALRRALELCPGYTPALRGLDESLRRRGSHAARLELCTTDIDRISDPAIAFLRGAYIARFCLDDVEAGTEQLSRAYKADPSNRSCVSEWVHWLAATGDVARAYTHASAYDAPKGVAAAAHHEYTLGSYAAALSNSPEIGWHYAAAALDHCRAALEHQPDHDLAFVLAERLCLAHRDTNNLAHLLRSQLATRRGPSQIVALTRLARVLSAVPDGVADVRAAYERAHKLAPDDPLLLFEFAALGPTGRRRCAHGGAALGTGSADQRSTIRRGAVRRSR